MLSSPSLALNAQASGELDSVSFCQDVRARLAAALRRAAEGVSHVPPTDPDSRFSPSRG